MKKILLIALCVLVGFSVPTAVYAETIEEVATETVEEVASDVEEIEETLSSAEELVLKIEQWQEYLDKYAMPAVLAILTSVFSAIALFIKFKNLMTEYEKYKAQAEETSEANWATFKAENEEMFAELKTSISKTLSDISENFSNTSKTTLEAVSNLPLESIKELLSSNTDDTAVTASCVLKLETLLAGITDLMAINEDVATVPADTKRAFKAKLEEIQQTLAESVMSENWTKLKEKVLEEANKTKLYEFIATVMKKESGEVEATEVGVTEVET